MTVTFGRRVVGFLAGCLLGFGNNGRQSFELERLTQGERQRAALEPIGLAGALGLVVAQEGVQIALDLSGSFAARGRQARDWVGTWASPQPA